MTRKHYVQFADLLAGELAVNGGNPAAKLAIRNVTLSLADILKRGLSRFDRAKFYAAVGI